MNNGHNARKLNDESQYTPYVTWIPPWMEMLEDREVTLGESLIYPFGDPVNIYGESMAVEIKLGGVTNDSFLEYLVEENTLIVHSEDQDFIAVGQVGTYRIRVSASTQTEFYHESYEVEFDLTVKPRQVEESETAEKAKEKVLESEKEPQNT